MPNQATFWGKTDVKEVGDLTVSGANTVVKPFGRPVDLIRLIFVTTTAITVANATITIGKRKVDDTGVVQHSQWTLPFTGSALNDVHEILPAESLAGAVGTTGVDGSTVHTAGNDFLQVNADEELYVTSDGGPTAGAVKVFAMIQEHGVTGGRYTATKLVEV